MDFLGDFAWAAAAWNITQAVLGFADRHIATVIVLALVAGLIALHKAPGAFKLNKIASVGLVVVALLALIFEIVKMFMAPGSPPYVPPGNAAPPSVADDLDYYPDFGR